MSFSTNKPYKTYTVQEALALLMKYCAYQDRCHLEVETKLKQLHMIPAAQEKIIIQLIQDGFLNEERFAKSYARGKFYIKHWGKQKIISQLKLKSIPSHLIQMALKEIPIEDYLQTIQDLALKKWKLLYSKQDIKTKQKIIQHLLYKGYEPELVYETVNEMINF